MPDEETTCSLCDKPLDTTGYPLWCKACRTDRKRALKQVHEQMREGKGFVAGAETMRRNLLQKLGEVHPAGMTSFDQITQWIKDFPAPKPN